MNPTRLLGVSTLLISVGVLMSWSVEELGWALIAAGLLVAVTSVVVGRRRGRA